MLELLLRFIYFLLIGWWLSGIAIFVAWVLNVLIITLPLGLIILNNIPLIATLRQPSRQWVTNTQNGVTVRQQVSLDQPPFILRAIYFVLIGWWFSLLWLYIAWLLQATIVLLPVTFFMYSKSAAVTTLRRT